jgi:adenine deaminase
MTESFDRARLIRAARGETEADTLFKNVRVLNVFNGETMETSVAVAGGMVAGFGPGKARETVDMGGRFLVPGLIDAHVHVESSMLAPPSFARAVLASGTTAAVADPHEIANVLGIKGVRAMRALSNNAAMRIYYMAPSCVPATHLETSGARLDLADIEALLREPDVPGLAEMMNFPGVLFGAPDVLDKIRAARLAGKRVDGHAPGLTGPDLHAYSGAGIASDHECTTLKEAKEKLALGMRVMLREGTGAKNLAALLPAVTPETSRLCMFCTDDRHAGDILANGHIASMAAFAIRQGIPPVTAVQMATLNPAEYFGLAYHGAVTPGRRADFLVVENLDDFRASAVYVKGKLCAEDGRTLGEMEEAELPSGLSGSMRVDPGALDFSIPAGQGEARVIGLIPGQIVTRMEKAKVRVENGYVAADTAQDILPLYVIERHTGAGNMGKGLVRGLGLKAGALAESVAHDSHNIVAAGVAPEDIRAAVEAVAQMGGGLAAAAQGKVLAALPLPVAGLMSMEPAGRVAAMEADIAKAARELGSTLENPLMTLSFLALPVIPELKLTDKGLVDVKRFGFVNLFGE